MFTYNYEPMSETTWNGRIDSETNYDAFRWHQWIKPLDLRNDLDAVNTFSFAFLGFCCDEGVRQNKGRTGAMNGPLAIRKELSKLPCTFNQSVTLFDAGDIIVENISLSEGQDLLKKAVHKLLSLNIFPIILGGGHETAFGNYGGVLSFCQEKISNPKIGIINFDAHFDLRPYNIYGTSGTMFRQISDICKNNDLDFSYFCMGIQEHSNTVELFKTANNLGVKYALARNMVNSDGWQLLREVNAFIKKQDYIYITICSDVFSASFAPGVSAPQTLGLNPEMVITLLKQILKSNKVISFDICEVAPRYDKDNITSNLASVLIFAFINTLCKINNLEHPSIKGYEL
ncbi:MAG: formimidoylglutamase [Clostridium sp.]|nr:formimidoylglutamase [Clostridium sp.]